MAEQSRTNPGNNPRQLAKHVRWRERLHVVVQLVEKQREAKSRVRRSLQDRMESVNDLILPPKKPTHNPHTTSPTGYLVDGVLESLFAEAGHEALADELKAGNVAVVHEEKAAALERMAAALAHQRALGGRAHVRKDDG